MFVCVCVFTAVVAAPDVEKAGFNEDHGKCGINNIISLK